MATTEEVFRAGDDDRGQISLDALGRGGGHAPTADRRSDFAKHAQQKAVLHSIGQLFAGPQEEEGLDTNAIDRSFGDVIDYDGDDVGNVIVDEVASSGSVNFERHLPAKSSTFDSFQEVKTTPPDPLVRAGFQENKKEIDRAYASGQFESPAPTADPANNDNKDIQYSVYTINPSNSTSGQQTPRPITATVVEIRTSVREAFHQYGKDQLDKFSKGLLNDVGGEVSIDATEAAKKREIEKIEPRTASIAPGEVYYKPVPIDHGHFGRPIPVITPTHPPAPKWPQDVTTPAPTPQLYYTSFAAPEHTTYKPQHSHKQQRYPSPFPKSPVAVPRSPTPAPPKASSFVEISHFKHSTPGFGITSTIRPSVSHSKKRRKHRDPVFKKHRNVPLDKRPPRIHVHKGSEGSGHIPYSEIEGPLIPTIPHANIEQVKKKILYPTIKVLL